jgi:hypothetical protein
MRLAGHVARIEDRRGAHKVLVGRLDENNHLEDVSVYSRIILRRIFDKRIGGLDWIDLAQDRNRWRALVNAVMNFRVS